MNNKIKFEGKYLNGRKWNGKGYDKDGNVIYELIKGNGKVKKYYNNGSLKFEGEYRNGFKNGKGKEYFDNNKIQFEGEYMNGKKWNGIEYDYEVYECFEKGILKNEIKNGSGYIKEYKEYYQKHDDGYEILLRFEGKYINGEKNGKSEEYIYDSYYDNFLNYKVETTLIFKGEYLMGEKNGKGEEYFYERIDDPINFYYDNHLEYKFEGEYLNGKKSGKGKLFRWERLIFEGEYLYDHKLKGKEYYEDGKLKFEGEYLNGIKWHRKGYDKDGKIIYELINGTGKVKEYYNNGNLKFEGEYKSGLRNGKGKEYKEYEDCGYLAFEGEYKNGEKWNGKLHKFLYEVEYVNGEIIENSSTFK